MAIRRPTIFCVLILTVVLLVLPYKVDAETRPGGAECKDNSVCYSHLCYINGICAPDGPAEGSVAGGGACSTDSDCFSGYCIERVCSPDSPVKEKIAAGGLCTRDTHCYSGTCLRRRCGPDSPVQGKMAAGGECEQHTQCYSGVCSYQRCAPDGSAENKAPGGGFCSINNQCMSNTCIMLQCSPDSPIERERTADGGRCQGDENCQSMSRCVQNICMANDGRQSSGQDRSSIGQPGEFDSQRQYAYQRLPAGAYCQQGTDCEAGCVNGRCAPPSRYNRQTIADGGQCTSQTTSTQGQCKSGQCITNVCATSYGDRQWTGATGAGAPCSFHESCYSGYCASGKCSSDSAAPLLPIFQYGTNQRIRGQVTAGGLCREDNDCYSGFCELNTICGPDGPRRGSLASGAICTRDEQCYSGYCFQRRCVAASVGWTGQHPSPGQKPQQIPTGKVAPGGRCAYTEACGQGTQCVDTYCKATEAHGESVNSNLKSTRPWVSSIGWNETCWHTSQCSVGRCLEQRCTADWYLQERYISSASVIGFHLASLVISLVVSRLL